MLVRIVKMSFRDEEVQGFLRLFEQHKEQIRNVEGCQHLQLLQDAKQASTFFTYSWWNNEECLNNYRESELFGEVWPKTKALFASKPEAWTCDSLYKLD
ncbi:MAG: putative quinol monooxygenase [Flavobacteriales bacterium]